MRIKGKKTEEFVKAELTEEQKAWGTSKLCELETVQDIAYETVENPTVTWKGSCLNLLESVAMRFKIGADNIEGLTVRVAGESGGEWTISSEKFEKNEDGTYYVYFDGLNAGQMSEPVYLTVYNGETAVSNTVRYSIESYAYKQQNSANVNLAALVKAMMEYGDAAYAYAN